MEIGIDSFAGGHTGDIHVRDNELIIDSIEMIGLEVKPRVLEILNEN